MPNWNTLTGSMGKTMAALVIGIVLLSPNTAFCDGNDLLSNCNDALGNKTRDALFGAGVCLGLMQGVTQLNVFHQQVLGTNALFCLPNGGIQNGQAARIVLKYLNDHPEKLHEYEISLVVQAFTEAFPCKK